MGNNVIVSIFGGSRNKYDVTVKIYWDDK
jgi:hypothetical protein